MSQKEKEIFEAQLMKEAEIRDRLKEVGRSSVLIVIRLHKTFKNGGKSWHDNPSEPQTLWEPVKNFSPFCFFQLQREVVQVGSLLETAITANPNAMRMYTPTILTTLLPLLQSPLTAPVMIPVLVKLGKSAFNDDQEHLGKRRLPASF